MLQWGSGPGGSAPGGRGCVLQGGSGPGGDFPASFCLQAAPPPHGQTHACENITLAQLRCGR